MELVGYTGDQWKHNRNQPMKLIPFAFYCGCFHIYSSLLCAETTQYYVAGWGYNVIGEATGVPSGDSAPGIVSLGNEPLTNCVAIAAGSDHSLALLADGSVVAWGGNNSRKTIGPVVINGVELTNVQAISACENYSLALLKTGFVVGWGNVNVPPGLSNVVAISAGASHSLALKADGTIVGWSAGFFPLGLSGATYQDELEEFIEMSNRLVSELGPGIKTNPAFWEGLIPTPPYEFYSGLSNFIAVAASRGAEGDDLALKKDGTVVEWPFVHRTDRWTMPSGLSNITAIASGGTHCLALKADGTIVGWGEGDGGQLNIPSGLRDVVAISADEYSTMVLKRDGTVAVWGTQAWGQTKIPEGLGRVVAIANGGTFCLALQTSTNLTNSK
jgi:alpha-tubulin suppressor-like RCC1 family protein